MGFLDDAVSGLGALGGQAVSSFLGGRVGDYFDRKAEERAWSHQKHMARWMHTYEVEDLKRAGLNPILSATKGPPSAPNVPIPGRKSVHPLELASAMKLKAETEEIRARTRLMQQQGSTELLLRGPKLDETRSRTFLNETNAALSGQRLQESMSRMEEIAANAAKLRQEGKRLEAEAYLRQREKELLQIVDDLMGPMATGSTAKAGEGFLKILVQGLMRALLK